MRFLHRGAVERALDGLVDHRPFEHPGDRALDRLAFDRGDDRLLGGDFDRLVDPVARPTAPAPRAPAPSSRAASGVLSSAMVRV